MERLAGSGRAGAYKKIKRAAITGLREEVQLKQRKIESEKKKADRPQPDKDRALIRQRWPHYTAAEKVSYIVSYYGAAIAAVLAAAVLVGFLIGDIQKKTAEESVLIIAAGVEIPEQTVAAMQEELARELALDPQKQKCVIDASNCGNANRQSEASLSAYMQSGRVDLLIAPEEVFNRYAATGYLMELEDAGTKDYFYASQVDYSQGGAVTKLPYHPRKKTRDCGCYGIYLDEGILKGYVAGIAAKSPHQEYGAKSLQYLAGERISGETALIDKETGFFKQERRGKYEE